MMTKMPDIPFSEPFIDEQESEAVLRVLRGKWLTTGPEVSAFETEMKAYLGGVKAAVAVSSGTAAVDVVLAACGIGPGDEVITTAYSFASPVLSMLHRGITPVFADIEPDTFNLSPEGVEALIEQRYRWQGKRLQSRLTGSTLKAILIVHYAGQPAETEAFTELSKRYNLQIIEDAAHAVGSRHRGRPVGASGHPVCFSFYSNKNLTTGEGGMVVWDRAGVEKVIRSYALHGISKSNLERYQTGLPYYDVVFPGYKANMNDLAAALGRVQLTKLDEITRRREALAQVYNRELADLPQVQIPIIRTHNQPSRHLYPLLVAPSQAHRRDDLIRHLRSQSIFPSVHFIPIHHHSFFRKAALERPTLPVTEDLFCREISLPLFPTLGEANALRVSAAVRGFWGA
jgi:dTDP-4-amino-4,6-dideoxygalactose transaminase